MPINPPEAVVPYDRIVRIDRDQLWIVRESTASGANTGGGLIAPGKCRRVEDLDKLGCDGRDQVGLKHVQR